MKLEKYVDKESKRRKAVLISLGVIVLISVSLLLYKTFASFTESAEFPMMKGKVDYFGNSDIYFAFYKGDEQLDEMPQKGNEDKLVFERGECDNGASIVWDNEVWGPMVKNLSKNKTKCSLYFKEQKEIVLGKDILPVESGDGLYAVPHDDLDELGQEWNQTEYRYAGVNPDNYVYFNNEIWRVIGLVNVKAENGIEQRLKIVRTDGVKDQKDFGIYNWMLSTYSYNASTSWTMSDIKDVLNGIYYESGIGECTGDFQCDFNTGQKIWDDVYCEIPKGLDETARNMIDKDVIWSLGGWIDSEITAKQFYEKERGTITGNNNEYPSEWSNETDVGEKHNGIGLIYPSDYGYAVGGDVRNSCLSEELCNYDGGNCKTNDWLYASKEYVWTFFPTSDSSGGAYFVDSSGGIYDDGVDCADDVWPTAYLTTTTKIVDGTGDINSPFVLSIQ